VATEEKKLRRNHGMEVVEVPYQGTTNSQIQARKCKDKGGKGLGGASGFFQVNQLSSGGRRKAISHTTVGVTPQAERSTTTGGRWKNSTVERYEETQLWIAGRRRRGKDGLQSA